MEFYGLANVWERLDLRWAQGMFYSLFPLLEMSHEPDMQLYKLWKRFPHAIEKIGTES